MMWPTASLGANNMFGKVIPKHFESVITKGTFLYNEFDYL